MGPIFIMKAKKLSNGMRYHLVPFSGTEAVTVLVLTKVGSRNEPNEVWGGSHFIEHLMFKGTERRPNTVDISKPLDRYGAQYNAYTGKDLTGYYVKIDGEQFDLAVDLLHDMVFHSLFDEKEMDRERRVIIEEIKMYEENPIMHLEDMLEQCMFEGNTLGKEIAGTPASMLSMKREDVLKYRDTFYVPSEMVVVIAGKVPEHAEALLEKTFGQVKSDSVPPAFVPFGEYEEREVPRVKIQEKPLEQIQLAFGFPMVGKGHDDVPAINLLANILGGAMSSRLFIEVRERRGLCYSVSASADAYEDIGVFQIRAGLDASRLKEASETILTELQKIQDSGVTDEELEVAKDNVKGGMKLRFENSSNRAEFYGRQELFFGEVKTLEEYLEKYDAVAKADIQRVAKQILNVKKMSVAAIGPYANETVLLEQMGMVK